MKVRIVPFSERKCIRCKKRPRQLRTNLTDVFTAEKYQLKKELQVDSHHHLCTICHEQDIEDKKHEYQAYLIDILNRAAKEGQCKLTVAQKEQECRICEETIEENHQYIKMKFRSKQKLQNNKRYIYGLFCCECFEELVENDESKELLFQKDV